MHHKKPGRASRRNITHRESSSKSSANSGCRFTPFRETIADVCRPSIGTSSAAMQRLDAPSSIRHAARAHRPVRPAGAAGRGGGPGGATRSHAGGRLPPATAKPLRHVTSLPAAQGRILPRRHGLGLRSRGAHRGGPLPLVATAQPALAAADSSGKMSQDAAKRHAGVGRRNAAAESSTGRVGPPHG